MVFSVFSAFQKGWSCKEKASSTIDQASDDSFPASDPPAWTQMASNKSPKVNKTIVYK